MLSFESNFEKSFTVSKLTVLSAIVGSFSSSTSVLAFSTSVSSSNDCFMFSPSYGFTNLTKYVLAKPINTAIIDVIKNTIIIVIMIFPSLLGVFIFVIDVVIVKKIKGTIITSNRFKNMSPKGFRIAAFS